MNLSVNLQIRQSQSLAMTPQLLQSIRLLQFHHSELASFLAAEVERNPLLTMGDRRVRSVAAPSPEAGPSTDASRASSPQDRFTGPSWPSSSRGSSKDRAGATDRWIENTPALETSMTAHALNEIRDVFADRTERTIAEEAFTDLSEAGYFTGDIGKLAADFRTEPRRLEALLRRLQAEAEPAGLFARDLAECLSLQLSRRDRLDPVMKTVLANLPLLARRDFATLARLTGEDEAGLLDILKEIRALDPRPGAGMDSFAPSTVVPDVVVRRGLDGGWQVELNPGAFPTVSFLSDRDAPPPAGAEERAFLTECRQSANWLLRSLDQRARTILKVAGEIARHQDAFLARGRMALRPLTLAAVADAIGLHESTVSRVTANKFIATPHGTFEMKSLFSVAIQAVGGGEAHSAESVKLRIRRMIDAEVPGAVLSDDDIAERLRGDGIDLARRTVAKYREALGLPSSIQRRRESRCRQLAS